jgi:apolipoprotein N-acyltransferase
VIAILCTALSAFGFYFSIGLGEQWWLAWLAPIPILWLAFGDAKGWVVFLLSWVASALGGSNILGAYGGTLPVLVLALGIAGPALLFAFAVMVGRRAFRAFGPLAGMFGFAASWAALDFLQSFGSAGGAIATPASAEVGAPILIQSASLVGFVGVTFLLGAFGAGIAASLTSRKPVPFAVAVVLFAANAGFGYLRISEPPTGMLRVALIESDDAVGKLSAVDKDAAFKVIDLYAGEIAKLRGSAVRLIVLPENIARVAPEWATEVQQTLAQAAPGGATVVAGFNAFVDGAQRNVSWALQPSGRAPVTYIKRRLVPVLESAVFAPGPGPRVLPNGVGLEICKDMDFHAMIRRDEVATKPELLAVPAWDFRQDGWSHARVAIMRSVENGVALARTARRGLLTLNDRYGRIVAQARSAAGFTTLIGDVPLAAHGGTTIYDRCGDIFAWLCLVIALGISAASFLRREKVARYKLRLGLWKKSKRVSGLLVQTHE